MAHFIKACGQEWIYRQLMGLKFLGCRLSSQMGFYNPVGWITLNLASAHFVWPIPYNVFLKKKSSVNSVTQPLPQTKVRYSQDNRVTRYFYGCLLLYFIFHVKTICSIQKQQLLPHMAKMDCVHLFLRFILMVNLNSSSDLLNSH